MILFYYKSNSNSTEQMKKRWLIDSDNIQKISGHTHNNKFQTQIPHVGKWVICSIKTITSYERYHLPVGITNYAWVQQCRTVDAYI